jgi:hypothetical protein
VIRADLPWKWVLLAGAVGFGSSRIYSSLLHWPRPWFVLAYSVTVSILLALYASRERVSLLLQTRRHARTGVVFGLLIGALLLFQVFSQPASSGPTGLGLLADLAWYGVVYGTADAVLLSVIPVLTLYGSQPPEVLRSPGGRTRWAGVAVAASALVTALYHLGFDEFRGPQVIQPVVGNLIITLGYLLCGSPLAAVVAHVLMHGGAVLHGMETTVQLPPHY